MSVLLSLVFYSIYCRYIITKITIKNTTRYVNLVSKLPFNDLFISAEYSFEDYEHIPQVLCNSVQEAYFYYFFDIQRNFITK